MRMAGSLSQLESSQSVTALARSLAPEDVRVGDFVAPLHETVDFPSFFWCCDAELTNRIETVPIRFVAQGSGVPLKVKAVCLPFVLVKHPLYGVHALDVRCHQLAKLDRDYGKTAWKAFRPRSENVKRKKRNKKSK